MFRKSFAATLVLAAALAVPGSSETAQAARTREIRVAMLAPRNSVLHRDFKRMDRDLRKATGDAWGIRVYPAGAAGDEKDTIRKMRVGQMDSAVVTTTGLSQMVRQVAILDTPGVIDSYKELEAVQKEMGQEWEQMFLKDGVKLLSWWEAGRYRLFSKGAVHSMDDFRSHRPWLWPQSYVLKEFWRAVGATGVPLGVPDVYGALMTGMIDMLVATPVVLVAMRWHTKMDHMSGVKAGVLLMSWIINKKTWEAMSDDARKEIERQLSTLAKKAKKIARKEDKIAYKRLLKLGYQVRDLAPDELKKWKTIQKDIQKRLVGRVYPAALLKRVRTVASGGA